MAQDKRQRQRENRQKRLEAERKAARAKALRRRIVQVVVLFVVVVAVLGINSLLSGDDETTTSTTVAAADSIPTTTTIPTSTTAAGSDPVAIPADYDGYRELPVACGGALPDPVEPMQFEEPEDQGINAGDSVTATIFTSCGDIVLELDPAAAPETVNSFVFLAREGYFDGQAFHRIVEGFMLQGGDQGAVGTGNPGYLLPDELDITEALYPKGTLAMANSGAPGSAGSQFFITFEDYTLTPSYSVFGRTVDSDATMDAIEALPKEVRPNGELSVPMEGLFIERIDIEIVAGS
ncbi:MAG: peptidylprolyl isomerase [Acidimicrobiia bacterium]